MKALIDEKKEIIINDSNADRFRICPNPSCGIEHYVTHRGKDYCSDQCADNHYNQKRRLKEHAKAKISTSKAEQALAEKQEKEILIDDQERSEIEKVNIIKLNELELNDLEGHVFTLSNLTDLGIDLRGYSTIGKLHNMPKAKQGQYIIIGSYRIFRLMQDQFLIYNTELLTIKN